MRIPAVAIAVGALALGACSHGEPPDIIGLSDQVAVVGQQFVLELAGTDPDGDALEYSVSADIDLMSRATISKTPTGNGVFRWTPLASDVGLHSFDFEVTDGSNDTTVTIQIDVRATSAGVPVFREPLSSGRVVNLATEPCINVPITIEDQDTAQVTIGQEEPKIAGATLTQNDGLTGTWKWCPTPAQVADSDRYTLVLSADDGDNPKVLKPYVLVLGGSAGGTKLVINEVDYDNIGTDSAEYIEIYNAASSTTSLAGLSILLVNGATNSDYAAIDLGPVGSLTAGQYLVIGGPSVTVPTAAKKLDPLWSTDQVQNGAPDGIALVDTVGPTLLDALSYEGSITAATLTGFTSSVSLVEGTALDPAMADSNTVTATLCRKPNGTDTNNASADWKVCSTRTVGTANN
ncbi:MAG TPA: lamin tail domain-containing protein [Kofleriaceae bacterium]|nr:lamin tail domain-containing protein [Kofleriaceae bacterium]